MKKKDINELDLLVLEGDKTSHFKGGCRCSSATTELTMVQLGSGGWDLIYDGMDDDPDDENF